MKKCIVAFLTAVAFAATATAAEAHTATVTVSACQNHRSTTQIDYNSFPVSKTWVAVQINVDDQPANASGLNDQGDAWFQVSQSARVGYIIPLEDGKHKITVHTEWTADGRKVVFQKDYNVDCGQPQQKIAACDGKLYPIEGPFPTCPGTPGKDGLNGTPGTPGKDGLNGTPGKDGKNGSTPRSIGRTCVIPKRMVVYVRRGDGGHGPQLTRVTVRYAAGKHTVYDRIGGRPNETKYVRLDDVYRTTKFLVTASIVDGKTHLVRTKTVTVKCGGKRPSVRMAIR